MQHVVCEGTAQLLSLTELIRIYSFFFYWLKPLADEGGEETGVPRENPDDELQKMPHTKTWNIRPQPRIQDLNPQSSIGGRLEKQMC